MNKCITPRCRKPRREGRKKCHRCLKSAERQRQPIYNAFRRMVDHAKERRILVTITRAEFSEWALASGLVVDGRRNDDLDIDRIEAHRGYELENIQPLRRSENIAKGNRERHGETYRARRWSLIDT